MRTIKASIIFLGSILIIIHFAGCRMVNEDVHGTPPSYQNQYELLQSSDEIIYGEVVKEYSAKK